MSTPTPHFDLPRLRPRPGAARDSLRLLHVIVGRDAHPGTLRDEIHAASRGAIHVECVAGLGRALEHLRAHPAALVLLQADDLDVARVALAELKLAQPALPVVLLTEAADDEAAVAAVRAGAEDCLSRESAGGARIVRAMRCALERTSHAATLRTQAVTDPLTGLPNRHALQKAIDHAMAMARRKGRALAVLFVDLDGFKDVNDACGHETGDRVLQEIARRFAGRTRDMDTVARIGGDEFVVVMEDLDDGRFAATLAGKLLTAAAEPLVAQGRTLELTASVGISVFPGDGDDAAALIRHADTAMYAAKAAGKNQYRYYRARMNEHSRARTALDAALDRAFDDGEFDLHYQPVWQASTKRISSCEALLRWRRPGHGLLLPAAFLDTADEAGLAGRLAQWVLTRAAATARRMREAGFDVPVSVNLSRRQLLDGEIAACVQRQVADGLEAGALQIEVAESVFVSDEPRLQQVLAEVAALGVGLIVDDFGSGVSSLRALRRVRPASIKIDGALARELPDGQDAAALVSAVVALGRTLGVHVVAEGVETEAQSRRLLSLGCDDLQGFYYGHALPDDEWLGYLRWACTAVVGTDGRTPPVPVLPAARRRRGGVTRFPDGAGLPGIPGAPRVSKAGHVVFGRFRS
jgi:diguanylate cyclase (GGDEF)-like protein